MNIVIIGCGKTGRRLASELDELGHDVSVVDPDNQKFEKLGEEFSGLCIRGSGIDTDVLKEAGCDNADVAVVITNSDNFNIMSAKILTTFFGINDVYVRVFDSSREAVFRKFGLNTVCSTRIEKDIFMALILGSSNEIKPVNINGTEVGFNMIRAEKKHSGKNPSAVFCKSGEMLFAVKKQNGAIFLANESNLIIEEGDMLIYALI